MICMEWKALKDKKVFIKLRDGGVYNGLVLEVDDSSSNELIWITILDKYNNKVTFVHSEIIKIEEVK